MQPLKQPELTNSMFSQVGFIFTLHLVFRKDSYQKHLKFRLLLFNVQVQILGKENAYKGLIVHNIKKKLLDILETTNIFIL